LTLEDEKDKHIKSIQKAIRILAAFSNEEPELGVVDLSKKLGLYKSTVFRFLRTLQKEDLVRRNPDTGKYRLGMRLFFMGSIAVNQLDIVRSAKPYLKELMELFSETVNLFIYDNGNVICIDRKESPRQVTTRPRGLISPPHCSGAGKAVLAFLPPREAEQIIKEKGLPPYTKKTITDPSLFNEHLKEITKRGYAIDHEEYEDGLTCVAVPLMDFKARVAGAISISMPTERLTEELLQRIILSLRNVSQKISCEMGYLQTLSQQKM
jgi:DNA-binding IclR family transcriptional regulator